AAVGAFSAVGLLDDLRPIPSWLKLFLQLLAAAMLVATLGPPLAVVWWLLVALASAYFVNVWNFMDGSNGMVAGQSLVIALVLSVWPGMPAPTRFVAWTLVG